MIWSVAHKYSLNNISSWNGGTWQNTQGHSTPWQPSRVKRETDDCNSEYSTNWAAQDKPSWEENLHGLRLSQRHLWKPPEQKINKGASAFRDYSAARETCFYISEIYSPPEKLEHTHTQKQQKNKRKKKKAEAGYNEAHDEMHSTKKLIHNYNFHYCEFPTRSS